MDFSKAKGSDGARARTVKHNHTVYLPMGGQTPVHILINDADPEV